MKLYFVRHGETQRGQNGVYGYSAPLTDLGHEQASKASDALSGRGVTHIVSSDAVRAVQTSAPLTVALNLAATVIPELSEIDIGIPSDGVTPITENRTPDGKYVMDCAHLGGESWDVFRNRVISGLEILADRFAGDDVIAVFTHGGVKSVALDHYFDREPSRIMHRLFDNGSISLIESNGIGHIVHSTNVVTHLE